MAEFKTVSLADQVFERLENDIITGVYARGEVLTELRLVEQLGVSRTPIREALRRLEQERLIEDTGKGSLVLGITLQDLEDIMDIRLRVEPLAAYYAALNIDAEGIANLRQISELQDFYYSKEDVDRLRQMDDRFHDAIYELSGRTVLKDTLRPLHRKTQRYRKSSIATRDRQSASILEHKALWAAICAKDACAAEKASREHILHAKENMIARYR